MALQALQTVLVPSCSLWPARYIKLVKHASNYHTESRIVVPLSMLLQDVCDGVIELRDPLHDLEDLMDEGVCAYGCSISLKVEWKWWVEWLDRMVRVHILCSLLTRALNDFWCAHQLRVNVSSEYMRSCSRRNLYSYAYMPLF
jgi:hypothetical protein